MEKKPCGATGATIERGKIKEATDNGFRVENIDERRGLITREITGIDDTEYAAGDIVYYFAFKDGTGKILCKA